MIDLNISAYSLKIQTLTLLYRPLYIFLIFMIYTKTKMKGWGGGIMLPIFCFYGILPIFLHNKKLINSTKYDIMSIFIFDYCKQQKILHKLVVPDFSKKHLSVLVLIILHNFYN